MTHQTPTAPAPDSFDPCHEVAQLHHALAVIERIAGRPPSRSPQAALDWSARISSAYGDALPIDRRRFRLVAARTTGWTKAGLTALVSLDEADREAAAAAAPLADALAKALRKTDRILGQEPLDGGGPSA